MATGNTRRMSPPHPAPQEESERLALLFRDRAASNQLPEATKTKQENKLQERTNVINRACQTASEHDADLTYEELLAVQKQGKDTAPGEDKITYAMIKRSGEGMLKVLLSLLNKTWQEGRLPDAWKTAKVQPIPKPKDPGNPRPIHLLSCLGKIAEKIIRRRLEHRIGQLHPQLFAYRRGVGTAENLAGILGTLDDHPSIIVFLDLEKAFELVSPVTILETLVKKGVEGRLLGWVKSYISNRRISVTFQGYKSTAYDLQNGTPQGGILSPLLFNIVMEQIVTMGFERDVKVLCYADDLQLIVQGYSRLQKTQRALRQIEHKCEDLGLKINPRKTKAMIIKDRRLPEVHLSMQGTDIEWVETHQCLGVFFDRRLSFQPHVEYLRERMAMRITAMRRITCTSAGADYNVLRTYYIQAVRSLLDYSSIALAGLQPGLVQKLQVQQNKALRLIVGAPVWTKIANLQMETHIAPVETRIEKIIASTVAKILTRPGYDMTRVRLKTAMAQGDHISEARWTRKASRALTASGLQHIATLGEDTPDEGHRDSPPWRRDATVFSYKIPEVPRSNVVGRRIHGELQIARLADEEAGTYFTDGSVDTDSGRSGAAFVYNGDESAWRLSDGCSSLQTELVAIQQATIHALRTDKSRIIIHTDSLSAVQTLQQKHFKDNIQLTSKILGSIRELQERGKQVIINWIPSHVGIQGNEAADKAAKEATALADVSIQVRPSLSSLRKQARRREAQVTTNIHRTHATRGSRSCMWYRGTTDYQRLELQKGTPRRVRVHLHRLRLGYPCNWRLIQPVVLPCPHCDEDQEEPLLHWIFNCSNTYELRRVTQNPDTESTANNAQDKATQLLKTLFERHTETLIDVIESHPPPR